MFGRDGNGALAGNVLPHTIPSSDRGNRHSIRKPDYIDPPKYEAQSEPSFDRRGAPATIQVSSISVPEERLNDRPLSLIAGSAILSPRTASDSSTDTIDGFVNIKPIRDPCLRAAPVVTITDELQSPEPSKDLDTMNTSTQPSKPNMKDGDLDTPHNTFEHVALDIDDDDSYTDDPIYTAMLNDQRNSLQMRSQAYASIAVVAALIAGISVTFVVEIDVNPESGDDNVDPNKPGFRAIMLQFCAVATLVVCFLALYGTMVLSMQYYLVTRALGHVSTISQKHEAEVLNEVSQFMKNTRWIRHLAVKCVVISVPLFGIVMGAFGVAKNGMGSVAYGSIACCTLACFFFMHAVFVQSAAFGNGRKSSNQVVGLPYHDGSKPQQRSKVLFETEKETFSSKTSSSSPQNKKQLKLQPKHLLHQAKNKASNFRLVW